MVMTLPMQNNNTSLSYIDRDAAPIVALCTGATSGVIGLIRISGADCITLVSRCARLSSHKSLSEVSSHTIHHGTCIDGETEKALDEVLFLVMKAPRTFTGEETVEITCHNNPLIIERIIEALCKQGARRAQPGEFTQRAFSNGKLDLIKAEAIHELITATNDKALEHSLAQVQGSLSSYIQSMEELLVRMIAYVESSFEFLEEEEQDSGIIEVIKALGEEVCAHIMQAIASYPLQEYLRQGARAILIGTVNAGKSTLLNTLVGRQRAIVSDKAGTTRDTIEASVTHKGYAWTIVDTAGLRTTSDEIEQEGIERAYAEAEEGDVVLLVVDQSVPLDHNVQALYEHLLNSYASKSLFVLTKGDKGCALSPHNTTFINSVPSFLVSSHTHQGVIELKDAIVATIQKRFETGTTPFLLNQRQYGLLKDIHLQLTDILNRYFSTSSFSAELCAHELKEVLALSAQLTGRGINERVMDTIFRSFCIGK